MLLIGRLSLSMAIGAITHWTACEIACQCGTVQKDGVARVRIAERRVLLERDLRVR